VKVCVVVESIVMWKSCVSVLMSISLRVFQDRHVGSTNVWWSMVSKVTAQLFCICGRLYSDMYTVYSVSS
jgi:hypothetical protein